MRGERRSTNPASRVAWGASGQAMSSNQAACSPTAWSTVARVDLGALYPLVGEDRELASSSWSAMPSPSDALREMASSSKPKERSGDGSLAAAAAEPTNETIGQLGVLCCVAKRLSGLVSRPVTPWAACPSCQPRVQKQRVVSQWGQLPGMQGAVCAWFGPWHITSVMVVGESSRRGITRSVGC